MTKKNKNKKNYCFTISKPVRQHTSPLLSSMSLVYCRRLLMYKYTFTSFDDVHPYFVHYIILYYRDMSIAIGNNNNILLPNLHCFGGRLIRHLSRPIAPNALQRAHILLFYVLYCMNLHIICILKFIFPTRMCAFLPRPLLLPPKYIIYICNV